MSIEQWSDLLFSNKETGVVPVYGNVRSVNDDGSYMVQLNASGTLTRCAPCCTAMVGDRVLVLIKPNGKCDAIGRLGGDLGGGGEIVTTVNDASNYVAGRVFAHAGTNDPAGALLCDGRAVSRTEYWELFDAIGITYGAGDGSSTFNLPNIASRTIIGESDDYALGATGGEATHTLTADEMPAHNHDVRWQNTGGAKIAVTGGESGDTMLDLGFSSWKDGSALAVVTGNKGGGASHNNMQPYIVMRYFITTGKGDPASGINPADYVVEWGNTGGWRWEKWASGKAECWGTFHAETVAASTWGSVYEVAKLTSQPYPFEFAEVPIENATARMHGYWVLSVETNPLNLRTATATGVYLATRATTCDAGIDVEFELHVLGRWKDSPASGGTATIAPTIAERFEELEARLAEAEYDTGWKNIYVVGDAMMVLARRVGKQVTVIGKSVGYYALTPNAYSNVTTLPVEFRPSVEVQFVKHNIGGDPDAQSNYITPAGLIRMYTTRSENSYWGFSVSYPAG